MNNKEFAEQTAKQLNTFRRIEDEDDILYDFYLTEDIIATLKYCKDDDTIRLCECIERI